MAREIKNTRRTTSNTSSSRSVPSSSRSRTAPPKTTPRKPAVTTNKSTAKSKPKASPKKTKKQKKERRPYLWVLVPLGTLLVIALAAWSYYPVARQQYISSRERDKLAAELAAVNKRNDKITSEIQRLKTPQGIEDYARSQMGWVKEGENAVVVEGLPADKTSIGKVPRVDSASVEITETPLTRFLDSIFKVKK